MFIMKNKVVREFRRNSKPLTNYEITHLAKELKIKNFRGVFMRDTLPGKVSPWAVECGIVNLDVSKNKETHWACYHRMRGIDAKNNDKNFF